MLVKAATDVVWSWQSSPTFQVYKVAKRSAIWHVNGIAYFFPTGHMAWIQPGIIARCWENTSVSVHTIKSLSLGWEIWLFFRRTQIFEKKAKSLILKSGRGGWGAGGSWYSTLAADWSNIRSGAVFRWVWVDILNVCWPRAVSLLDEWRQNFGPENGQVRN